MSDIPGPTLKENTPRHLLNAVSRLTGDAAHTVALNSGLLRAADLSDSQRDWLRQIQAAARDLLQTADGIRDFVSLDTGTLTEEQAPFSLNRLLLHLQAQFQVVFQQRGVALECEFAAALPESVRGDEKLLSKMLSALLHNAGRIGSGSVSLRAFPGNGENRHEVNFFIGGTGASADLTAEFGYITARKICEAIGGVLTAEKNSEDFAFRVNLSLPAELPSVDPAAAKPEEEIPFIAPDARILLVDDIELNLLVASAILGEFKIYPLQAVNGRKALELVRQREFDLIFMDHLMPEMDGVETTQAIRAMGGWCAKVPIVALTANTEAGAMEMFLANGFDGFIPKPIDAAVLNSCLRRWLPSVLIRYI